MTSDKNIGYLLTGDRSKFAETGDGGATLWLYTCKQKTSDFKVLPECYNMIPINDYGTIKFVDPVDRKTYKTARIQDCHNAHDRPFHLDLQKITHG